MPNRPGATPINVLLLEKIHPDAAGQFRAKNYAVAEKPNSPAGAELGRMLGEVQILGIRSKTKVTPTLLQKAPELLAVGCFCIGTDQVDLKKCSERGIAVFNAPFSSTRSVTELVIGEIIMLLRRAFERSAAAHQGTWAKGEDASFEVRGKTLGIVGYGHIGSQVSVLAEALGMNVAFYDVAEKLALGNARPVHSLEELLRKADIVTLHVPEDKSTRNMIGARQLEIMRKGSYLINTSRGSVVVLEALHQALKEGHLRGAAVDVYPNEPSTSGERFSCLLQGLPNVILTPHVAGSTEEAQADIAQKTSNRLIRFLEFGTTAGSVNFPEVELPVLNKNHRIIHIHKNTPGVIKQVAEILARHQYNIEGEYLRTTHELGYLVTDVNRKVTPEVQSELKKVRATLKVRVLF
ncbi:MAG: phosphoglycerate dehydrogenase [candidate division Zixibacteria bacterium]|nr:phosphoglycerate dehydrogenase [candidate division Zixibacteria bacterium]